MFDKWLRDKEKCSEGVTMGVDRERNQKLKKEKKKKNSKRGGGLKTEYISKPVSQKKSEICRIYTK